MNDTTNAAAGMSDEQIDALMPLPDCTYADYSYPAYTKRRVRETVRAALAASAAQAVPAPSVEFLRRLKSAADWSGNSAVNEAYAMLDAAPTPAAQAPVQSPAVGDAGGAAT